MITEYQKITNLSKNSLQNNSENNKQVPKQRYISPEEKQTIIDNLGINIIV